MNVPVNRQRIFMAGASGFVGSTVAQFAIMEGYAVYGLASSEMADTKLEDIGVTAVRGDLRSLDVLRTESAKADIVLHVADTLGFTNLGNYDAVIQPDGEAVDAMAEGLKGTGRPLVITSGTLVAAPEPDNDEMMEDPPTNPKLFIDRGRSERYATLYADKGIKVICIRLVPMVCGLGGSAISMFISSAYHSKRATYVDDGHRRDPTVNVKDAARLFLLAAQHANLIEVIASVVGVPKIFVKAEDAGANTRPVLSNHLTSENRTPSVRAGDVSGWQPHGPGLLQDVATESYYELAQNFETE